MTLSNSNSFLYLFQIRNLELLLNFMDIESSSEIMDHSHFSPLVNAASNSSQNDTRWSWLSSTGCVDCCSNVITAEEETQVVWIVIATTHSSVPEVSAHRYIHSMTSSTLCYYVMQPSTSHTSVCHRGVPWSWSDKQAGGIHTTCIQ